MPYQVHNMMGQGPGVTVDQQRADSKCFKPILFYIIFFLAENRPISDSPIPFSRLIVLFIF